MIGSALLATFLLASQAAPQDIAAGPRDPQPRSIDFSLRLNLRDFETEAPVTGVRVEAREAFGAKRWKASSDKRGAVELASVPAGSEIELLTHHPVYAARKTRIFVDPSRPILRIYLLRAVTLKCRLQAPPAGRAQRTLRFLPIPDSEAASVLEGKGYSIPVPAEAELPPLRLCRGTYTVSLLEGNEEVCEWSLRAGELSDEAEIEFLWRTGPGRVTGLIMDEMGQPHHDAKVRLIPLDGEGGNRLTACDAEGHFDLQGIPFGSYRLQAVRRTARNFFDLEELILHTRSQDVLWGARKITLSAEQPTTQMRFGYDENAVNLTGILLRESIPIPGWRVMLEDESGENLWISEHSRPDGMFEIPGLPRGGRYRVSYQTPTAWTPAQLLEVGENEREVHYFNVSKHTLTGQIFYKGTRVSPGRGEIVIHTAKAPELQWIGWLAPDGTFEIPSLKPGAYEMWIQAEDCDQAHRDFKLDEAQAAILDVAIELKHRSR